VQPRTSLVFGLFLPVDRSNLPNERVKYGLPPPTLIPHPKINALPAAIQHSLLCHPTSPCRAVKAAKVSAELIDNGTLALRYQLDCNPADILLPVTQPATAADDLWQHTCCEAFIAAGDGREYREFNFSPSGQWANYRFTDYRARDTAFIAPATPQITVHSRDDGLQLDALLGREMLPVAAAWKIGLSIVIEAADGSKSYWALAHCAAQPDFHRRQSFTLTLNPVNP